MGGARNSGDDRPVHGQERETQATKFNEEWTVGPHGDVENIAEGVLSVPGEIVMPLGRFPRRMTVVRLEDGTTAIWSAIALAEPDMACCH